MGVTAALLLPLAGCADSGPNALDGAKVKAWLTRYFDNQPRQNQPDAARVVYIDTAVLVRLHPAWQLAQALEATHLPPAPGQVAIGSLAPPSLPAVARPLPDPAPRQIPQTVVRSGMDEKESRQAQAAAGDQFLATTAKRQARQAVDEEALARQALKEKVEAARKAMLSELDPTLLPEEVQRELINLRLTLVIVTARADRERATLRRLPPAEREPIEARLAAEIQAAQAPIQAIEDRWRAQLKRQEASQLVKVREAYQDEPARILAVGEEQIKVESRVRSEARGAEREQVRQNRNELLERDFAPGSLDLAQQLPAARVVPAPLVTPGRGDREEISQTFGGGIASVSTPAPHGSAGAPLQGAAARARQLRQLAYRETAVWARLAAVRMGKTFTPDRKAPNGTAEAVRLLSGQISEPGGIVTGRKQTRTTTGEGALQAP